MSVAAALIGVVGALAAAIIGGVSGARSADRQAQALGEAKEEDLALYQQERADILKQQDISTGFKKRELRLYEDKFRFDKSEAAKAAKQWEREFSRQEQNQAIQNALGIINNNATLRQNFATLAPPKRRIFG